MKYMRYGHIPPGAVAVSQVSSIRSVLLVQHYKGRFCHAVVALLIKKTILIKSAASLLTKALSGFLIMIIKFTGADYSPERSREL